MIAGICVGLIIHALIRSAGMNRAYPWFWGPLVVALVVLMMTATGLLGVIL